VLTRQGDQIYTVLGCRDLLILRPVDAATYQVVGCCHIHGLSDAEKLMGPLPNPWVFRVSSSTSGSRTHCFHNSVTGENSKLDPRLEAWSPEWELCEAVETEKEEGHDIRFRNKETGEVLNSDPRLLPAALESRGITVKRIRLV
jgi:hypothetical protein